MKHLYCILLVAAVLAGCTNTPLSVRAHRISEPMEYEECPDTLVVTCKRNKLHIDRLHYVTSTHRDFLPVYQLKGDTLLISDSSNYFCFCLSEFQMEYKVRDLPFGRYLLVCGLDHIEQMDSFYMDFPPTYIDFQPDMQPVYIPDMLPVYVTEQEEDEPLMFQPMPEFPGGISALQTFLKENIRYPEQARKDSIQGHVICRFDVQVDGSITGIEVARSSGSSLLDEEAVRVLSTMPQWEWEREPSEEAVVRFMQLVNFKLE